MTAPSGSGTAAASGSAAGFGERAVPYYCPYCGDEDLRPSADGHGVWECRGCARAFGVRFIGLLRSALDVSAVEVAR